MLGKGKCPRLCWGRGSVLYYVGEGKCPKFCWVIHGKVTNTDWMVLTAGLKCNQAAEIFKRRFQSTRGNFKFCFHFEYSAFYVYFQIEIWKIMNKSIFEFKIWTCFYFIKCHCLVKWPTKHTEQNGRLIHDSCNTKTREFKAAS